MQDETQLDDDDGCQLEPLSPEDEAWLIGLLQELFDADDRTGDPDWQDKFWKRIDHQESVVQPNHKR